MSDQYCVIIRDDHKGFDTAVALKYAENIKSFSAKDADHLLYFIDVPTKDGMTRRNFSIIPQASVDEYVALGYAPV